VNGGLHEDGGTNDGIARFLDRDVLQWNKPY
jgi:hypothetical protein